MADDMAIGIVVDNGYTFWTHINGAPSGSTVTLHERLSDAAASGNTVYFAYGDRFLTATEVTASDL